MGIVDARFGSYLLVAALLIVAPGPDMALVTRNALSAGRRAALFTAFGIGIGILGWALAAAIGVATLLERSALAFLAIKLVGASGPDGWEWDLAMDGEEWDLAVENGDAEFVVHGPGLGPLSLDSPGAGAPGTARTCKEI